MAEKHAPFVTQSISGHIEAWVTEDLIIIHPRLGGFQQKRNHVNRLKNRLKNDTMMRFYSNNKTRIGWNWLAAAQNRLACVKYFLNQSFQYFFTNWISTKMLED